MRDRGHVNSGSPHCSAAETQLSTPLAVTATIAAWRARQGVHPATRTQHRARADESREPPFELAQVEPCLSGEISPARYPAARHELPFDPHSEHPGSPAPHPALRGASRRATLLVGLA